MTVKIQPCMVRFGMEIADKDLANFLRMSQYKWMATINGELACIWGLVTPCLLSEEAYIWLYTTPVSESHPFLMARYSQRLIREMPQQFKVVSGHCLVSDERAQRWLKWLGAKFGYPEERLIPFKIRNP